MPHETGPFTTLSSGCSLAGRCERFTQFAAKKPGEPAANGQTGKAKHKADVEPVGQFSAGLDTDHQAERSAQAETDHGNRGEQQAKDT
ncbi:hypothetical protein CR152_07335 [Massilia violaceinigra]|uniref:Uncharacterized protein n=1 Tax=Massilia violaceinigra TaxID=2045208 RepID=A0A2D2DH79_9BURK|nr:hypothetical protein CR152_07335 [Massilia violaceinigra]